LEYSIIPDALEITVIFGFGFGEAMGGVDKGIGEGKIV
jgi:hypothetical protein